MKIFYSHLWKSFLRNERWRRNLITKILFGVLICYFILLFIMLGVNIDKILAESGGDPIQKFNSILLWYLAIDLFLRCLLQPLPAIEILPYLRLRIRRSKIITYLLVRSFVNFFNIIPLFVVVPFCLKILAPHYGTSTALIYIGGFSLLLVLNNYLSVITGYLTQKKSIYLFIPLSIVIIVVLLNKWGVNISTLSVVFGRYILEGNLMLIGSLLSAIIIIIYTTKLFLSRNFYIDEIKSGNQGRSSFISSGINRIGGFGEIGRYLSLEINLLMRNKRPRQMLVMVPLFLVYFLFMIYNDKNIQSHFSSLLLVTMLTGMGAAMYGQFMFSWESTYFDCIMARKINFINYVKAKYYMSVGLALASFVPIVIFFSITAIINIYLIISILFFTLGVNNFIIMFFGTLNDGRIDLGKKRLFNYQGIKGSQFILTFLYMLLPLGIFSFFKYFFNEAAGEIALAVPGLILIAFHDWWIKRIIVSKFLNRKYKNLEGYRKLSY
jgi:hypothetical protein